MIVISDTSPLRYLVVIGQVEILPKLYGKVFCPPEVISECLHPRAPEPLRAWASTLPTWLEVVASPAWERSELQGLDAGEAAALRLAHDLRADIVLMDERDGRHAAALLGFAVAGVLAVLADASRAGLLDFDAAISDLLKNTNFRVSERVIARIRSRLPSAP